MLEVEEDGTVVVAMVIAEAMDNECALRPNGMECALRYDEASSASVAFREIRTSSTRVTVV